MPVQLQYVQLIANKTNTADLSSSVFAILISVTQKKILEFIAFSQILSNLANNDVTKETLNCTAFLAAESIVDAIISSGVLFCDPKTSSAQIQISPDLCAKSNQVLFRPDLK